MGLRRILPIVVCLALALAGGRSLAQSVGGENLAIYSPTDSGVVGGIVSIIGTANVGDMQGFTVSFGLGEDPQQWIAIGEMRTEAVIEGRLALWDTTQIPDGAYTLRLRALVGTDVPTYQDAYVYHLFVSNAPRTATPLPTLYPSATPTATVVATVTPTPLPTVALEDGISPYLYLTMTDQSDPLCLGWRQRYSIWLSNIGSVTVTRILITDTLPAGTEAILSDSTFGASLSDEDTLVTWQVDALAPGQALQFELQVSVASWMEAGEWLENLVEVSSDQLPFLAKSEVSLLSTCPWLKETETARPLVLPTEVPATPTLTTTATQGAGANATPLPTATPTSNGSFGDGSTARSLDLVTVIISVALGILLVVTIVLVYRNVVPRK